MVLRTQPAEKWGISLRDGLHHAKCEIPSQETKNVIGKNAKTCIPASGALVICPSSGGDIPLTGLLLRLHITPP